MAGKPIRTPMPADWMARLERLPQHERGLVREVLNEVIALQSAMDANKYEFNAARVLRGELDAVEGNVVPFGEVMDRLRGKIDEGVPSKREQPE